MTTSWLVSDVTFTTAHGYTKGMNDFDVKFTTREDRPARARWVCGPEGYQCEWPPEPREGEAPRYLIEDVAEEELNELVRLHCSDEDSEDTVQSLMEKVLPHQYGLVVRRGPV